MRFSFTILVTVSLFITQHMASAAPAVEAPTSLAANAVSQSRIDLSYLFQRYCVDKNSSNRKGGLFFDQYKAKRN